MVEKLFSVQCEIPLNLEFLGSDYEFPDEKGLAAEKPEVFKLCGALSHVDFKTERAIRENGDEFSDLVDVLDRQSDKINQILSFLISVYDKKYNTYETFDFSGNGFSFICPNNQAVKTADIIRTRIYLMEDSAAVYCYARVISDESAPNNDDSARLLRAEFVSLEEEDRERIISACFGAQRRLLRQRSKLNNITTKQQA